MNFETLSQWRRSAFCAAMAARNCNHIYLFSDINDQEPKAFDKLLSKTWSFLQGELKSIDNLERFFNEFDTWQSTLLEGHDSFGAEAAQQACQSLYSASYALLDEGANDCDLVVLSNQQLLAEFAELGNDAEELITRQATFEQSVFDLLTAGKPKRETIIAVQKLATSEEESSLGIILT